MNDNGSQIDSRLVAIEKLVVNSPERQTILARIDRCRTRSQYSAEPDCMCIFGPQGVGKTTIAEEYTKRFPIREEPEQRIVPVLNITTPSPATVKGLATAMLLGLGDPKAECGDTVPRTLRLYQHIHQCKVEQIILDELQHFGDYDSEVPIKKVSNWLKNLINYCKIPIVLMGMPYAEDILTLNDQLARRFEMRVRLKHFLWKGEEDCMKFRQFIKTLTDALPLQKNPKLIAEDTALRIFCATKGRLSFVVALLRRAAGFAVERKLHTINFELLGEVYAETLGTLVPSPSGENPFVAGRKELNEWMEEIHKNPNIEALDCKGNRQKRKSRSVRSSDILRQ